MAYSYAQDVVEGSRLVLGLKGRLPSEELVAENPETPDIHPLVVSIALDHLGWDVVWGSAEGLAQHVWGIDCPSEIADLDRAERVQQILRFDITMNNILRVHVDQGLGYLLYVVRRSLLIESFIWLISNSV